MDDGFGDAADLFVDRPVVVQLAGKQGAHDLCVGQVADDQFDFLAGQRMPEPGPLD